MKDVFKQELWAQTIQNALDKLTGLFTHSDYSYTGEIKYGNKLHITGSIQPTVGDYVPGKDITIEEYSGDEQVLDIDTMKYVAMYFDDVDQAQSIPGVMENQCNVNAKYLKYEADKKVASTILKSIESNDIKVIGDSFTPAKGNATERVENALVQLYENDVNPVEDLWGEFSPKMYSAVRQSLTETLTNNVELAKEGVVGKYNNVKVTIENLLPVKDTTCYNIVRTGKAVGFAGQVDKIERTRKEKGFGDIFKALYVCGCKVVRKEQIVALPEKITAKVTTPSTTPTSPETETNPTE